MTETKIGKVTRMFDRIAPRYDLANKVMTAGADARWRRHAVSLLDPKPGERILDVGCGTGKLVAEMTRRATVSPIGIDPARAMLDRARITVPAARLVLADGERLPFRDGSFDGAINGFVLRNLESLPAFFAEMQRVLTPGGRFVSLEIAKPTGALYGPVHSLYFGRVVPVLGGFVSGDQSAYAYLARSVEGFPDPARLSRIMEDFGFHVTRHPLAGGAVVAYVAARKR